jgi:hypothetical protein
MRDETNPAQYRLSQNQKEISLKLNAARYMRAASFGDRLTEQVTEQVR